jgi:hypothetical protein
MHGLIPVCIVNKEILENNVWIDKLKGYREKFGSE